MNSTLFYEDRRKQANKQQQQKLLKSRRSCAGLNYDILNAQYGSVKVVLPSKWLK